jgi:predicted metal-binding membrane protein
VTGATTDRALEAALRRDRRLVIASVIGIAALAWLYLLRLGASMPAMSPGSVPAAPSMPGMSAMPGMSMPGMDMPGMAMAPTWGVADFVVAFGMWAVMMVAMMVPSAAPVLVLFAGLNRRRREQYQPAISTAFFLTGYLVVWAAFSLLAALAQGALHSASLLSPALAATSATISGSLLILAGIYQWTPLKSACLAACRSPLGFLVAHWRDGARGAVAMGLRHGLYCVGCCWLLMALLFAAGVMNLVWVALIAVFVLVEKVVPGGPWVGRLAGLALVVVGVVVMRAG